MSQSFNPVTAIVLAGGFSRRMAVGNKLLQPLGKHSILRQTVLTLLQASCVQTLVVLGHDSENVRASLAGLNVDFIQNKQAEEGMAASLRAGVGALKPKHDFLICLADMPFVQPQTIRAIYEARKANSGLSIWRPTFLGQPGHPILWAHHYANDFLQLQGDTGGRKLLQNNRQALALVPVNDAGILQDIDTDADLHRFRHLQDAKRA
ncbi:MAG TPA: nucleotidyltransferase family protein [Burkholderiaceae bacterium]|nr:nucleotidyltransferase family protein [Burkholderiaceae bacterium]